DLLILDCPYLPVSVILATLRCLSVSQHGRQLRGPPGSPAELRLEALASGLGWPGGLRAACLSECPARDFSFELPRVLDESSSSCLTVLSLPAAGADRSPEALLQELIEAHSVPSSHHPALRLQLSLWCHARSTQGRREVVAIALYALCNTMRHLGPFSLQQLFLQKWPGLFAELCDLLQCLQLVGPDVGVAALRAAGALLDSRYGQSRAETSQLSQMLGLAMPHGILANALRGLLSGPPVQGRPAEQHQVLIAALDLFQVTTAANHQSTIQLGNAGMVMSMLELLQQTDVASLPAVMAMLRCLELASEVSSATALVLFREFHGLQAFSTRLQKELELLLALSFQGDVHNAEPPAEAAPEAERAAHWDLLLEVTARRRLCRQFLKNIQVALHCSEVVQAGLANVFQGPLMEVLKKAFEEPQKVGLCLFGSSVDIVSNLIQDDPSRVPQMIESRLLPGIFASLSRDTLRSVECLTFIPGVLGAISLHAAGEDFILKSSAKPLKLLVDIQLDPSFAPLLHSQPELIQIISTHVDKVIRNRPTGSMLLTEHVVECLVEALRSVIESSKAYPDWDPTELEDRTDALADRLAAFGRFCWSVLGGGDTAKLFSEKQGFALVREAMELRCLPFQLCSLEGQQHPLGSLFGVQASRPNPGANPGAPIAVPDVSPVLKLLQDMLSSHHGQTMAFVTARVPLLGSTDPYEALAACPVNEVMGFLRSLSGAMTALEGLLSVCREGSSGLPLESLTEPLNMVQELAPLIFRLSAWRAKDKDPKASQIGTYAELVSSVFGEGRQALGNRPTPITVEAEQPRSGESQVQAEQRRIFAAALAPAGPATSPATDRSAGMEVDAGGSSSSDAKDSSSMKTPLARASRQCFRLAARTLRQLLVLASKQLQNRARIRDMMPAAVTLSRQLSQVSKAVLSIERPAEPAAALRWVGDSFELLLKMHEEQNKVAVRPTCICSFYQDAGFELLGPLLQFASQGLGQGSTDHQHLASIAFSGAVGYFEKVTSFKRFSNALQFRTEDGLIPKDDLCRSVQAQALKCVLPVWRQSDLSLAPKSACGSLMKVFLHPLQEKAASEVPLLPPREARGMSVVPHPAAAFLQSFGLAPTAAQPRAAPPPPPSAVAPAAVAADAAPSALLLGTLVEMGFTREQVEAAVQQLTPLGGGGDI
ncbi:unnamed protein product, partial [Polarella glacialis]